MPSKYCSVVNYYANCLRFFVVLPSGEAIFIVTHCWSNQRARTHKHRIYDTHAIPRTCTESIGALENEVSAHSSASFPRAFFFCISFDCLDYDLPSRHVWFPALLSSSTCLTCLADRGPSPDPTQAVPGVVPRLAYA